MSLELKVPNNAYWNQKNVWGHKYQHTRNSFSVNRIIAEEKKQGCYCYKPANKVDERWIIVLLNKGRYLTTRSFLFQAHNFDKKLLLIIKIAIIYLNF